MKLGLAIVLSIILIFIGIRVISFVSEQRALQQNLSEIEARITAARTNQASLEARAHYLSNPANLEKEFRAEFNYVKPGEKMIVIVPPESSTTP